MINNDKYNKYIPRFRMQNIIVMCYIVKYVQLYNVLYGTSEKMLTETSFYETVTLNHLISSFQ